MLVHSNIYQDYIFHLITENLVHRLFISQDIRPSKYQRARDQCPVLENINGKGKIMKAKIRTLRLVPNDDFFITYFVPFLNC